MIEFYEYLQHIDNEHHREKVADILQWLKAEYPQLDAQMKWNTPMFTDSGSFIIGLSTAKGHISIALEQDVIAQFEEAIEQAGYSQTERMFRIRWGEDVDYDLLKKIVDEAIEKKQGQTTFWQ
ncbi:iron chaperone [Salisediminibacterium halotolerans]|uniref:YdhG-like domain-containing protein n=1 Tax=Salisediminibacterium halotolerans TaxID=517425 RepID=A0A1H9SUV4_9BACI|nr:DUF1801 domain-containing protein [Salisediminibacterium haloalkalitolerans]SER88782.1 hypothetical protein SAMN05444126_10829 [Salisediminibacterium haloalkalitolerans]